MAMPVGLLGEYWPPHRENHLYVQLSTANCVYKSDEREDFLAEDRGEAQIGGISGDSAGTKMQHVHVKKLKALSCEDAKRAGAPLGGQFNGLDEPLQVGFRQVVVWLKQAVRKEAWERPCDACMEHFACSNTWPRIRGLQ